MSKQAKLQIFTVLLLAGLVPITHLTADQPPAEQDEARAVAEIAGYLESLEKLGFAGAVVIARDGRPLLADGYGLASREEGIPWSPSTITTIGSITKQLTGAAILALAEEGKLSVSDTLTDHFENVPEDKRGISVHQLLTHSSGIVNLAGVGDFNPVERDEYVRRALAQELAFPPGEGYRYSNAGYSLLAAIIEQLTGGSYEEYVRRRLFLPAGMYETGYILAGWDPRRLAVGYRPGGRWGTVLERPMADDGPYWALRGNGGIHATAWDMLRWGQSLLAGRVLAPASMERYWGPHVDEGGGDSFYGYGWVVMELGGTKIITHNGGNSIFFADMALVPATGLVIFYATNVVSEMPVAGGLLEPIGMRLAAGQPLPEVPDREERGAEELAALAGSYMLTAEERGEAGAITGGRVEVVAGDGALRVVPRDPSAFSRLLSQRPVDPARAERLSARIGEIVGALTAGDAAPLARAYSREVTEEALAARWDATRGRLESMNGPFQGYEVLGTAFRESRDVTLVRLRFENGHADRAYVWDPEEEESLRGVSVRGMDAELLVLPVTGGGWATWDGRVGESRPVELGKGEGGAVRLAIGAEGGLVAVRAGKER